MEDAIKAGAHLALVSVLKENRDGLYNIVGIALLTDEFQAVSIVNSIFPQSLDIGVNELLPHSSVEKLSLPTRKGRVI